MDGEQKGNPKKQSTDAGSFPENTNQPIRSPRGSHVGRDPHAGSWVAGPGCRTSYFPPSGCRGQVQKGHTWPLLSLADLGPSQAKVFSFPFVGQRCPHLYPNRTLLERGDPHTQRADQPPATGCLLPWDSLGLSGRALGSLMLVHSNGDQLPATPDSQSPPKIGAVIIFAASNFLDLCR